MQDKPRFNKYHHDHDRLQPSTSCQIKQRALRIALFFQEILFLRYTAWARQNRLEAWFRAVCQHPDRQTLLAILVEDHKKNTTEIELGR